MEDLNRLRLRQYRNVSMASLGLTGEHEIAVVYAVGSILRGQDDTEPFFGANILGSDSFSGTLREVKDNDDIEAVVVRIDSPGGDAFASDQIWREMNRLSEGKPLIVSFSDAAASGGYYIGMAKRPDRGVPRNDDRFDRSLLRQDESARTLRQDRHQQRDYHPRAIRSHRQRLSRFRPRGAG